MPNRLTAMGGVSLVIISLFLWSAKNWAADPHTGHTPGMTHDPMNHDPMMHSGAVDIAVNGAQPREAGQATFAALVEMVAILEQDTATDWSKVDIDGLRSHLLDMNNLVRDTNATKTVTGERQIRFDIRGTANSIASIHRMVPAHSRYIEQSRGWTIKSELNDAGATLTIEVEDASTLNRLRALGFYGFMSLDSHHQAHHYQMVLGMSH